MQDVVLLFDDEPNIRRDLGHRLSQLGYAVHKAETIEEAKKVVLAEPLHYAIVDLKVDYRSEYGGAELVAFVKRHQPRTKVVVLSAYSVDDAEVQNSLLEDADEFVSKKGQDNYIRAVIDRMKKLSRRTPPRSCFVIMPFSDTESCSSREWTEIFEELFRPAVENAGYGLQCTRSSAVQGSIIESILDNLNRSDMVVADLTDRNPNVFYELGVRHTLRDSTLLVAQTIDDVPFDLQHYAVQTYEWKTKRGREEFAERVKNIIGQLSEDPRKGASPVRKYLGVGEEPRDVSARRSGRR